MKASTLISGVGGAAYGFIGAAVNIGLYIQKQLGSGLTKAEEMAYYFTYPAVFPIKKAIDWFGLEISGDLEAYTALGANAILWAGLFGGLIALVNRAEKKEKERLKSDL